MMSFEEFLRESSQAGPTSSEADRNLQMLVLMHRRNEWLAESTWRPARVRLAPSRNPRPAPVVPSSAASETPADPPGSLDSLVGRFRHISALQELVLGNADRESSALTYQPDAAGGDDQLANRRDRNRSIVDSPRAREARLRAMQQRIEQLVAEFAALRSAQREMRRVSGGLPRL